MSMTMTLGRTNFVADPQKKDGFMFGHLIQILEDLPLGMNISNRSRDLA